MQALVELIAGFIALLAAAVLMMTVLSACGNTTVTNNGDGTFSFAPGSDFQDLNGGDTRTVTFTYTATDSRGAVSSPATITLAVAGTNDGPVASATAIISTT